MEESAWSTSTSCFTTLRWRALLTRGERKRSNRNLARCAICPLLTWQFSCGNRVFSYTFKTPLGLYLYLSYNAFQRASKIRLGATNEILIQPSAVSWLQIDVSRYINPLQTFRATERVFTALQGKYTERKSSKESSVESGSIADRFV